ncbi:type II toxin-antitoxin system Phd/YefM family antitoxin [Granulicella aggregans]|jgi:prevent-host-death family protein|uniref:type II toxin-antitoxin system Phd/YefM family antitoxin n=1 Tax=Granulicella aggregans TaxID=474949 RepID=UPI0021E098E5|nr:type II toxin-antitoxin system prevent-host-death family antitoxin [Granulicella aggregans]
METVNMHEAKTHLSRLVEKAVKGEPFIIARAGKPLVKVTAIDEDPKAKAIKRIGFLDGQCKVPDDFDTMGQAEIEEMFYGKQD